MTRRPIVPLLLLVAGPALAQPSEIRGVISAESGRRITIAIPPVEAPASGLPPGLAAEIHQVLRDDLAFSGYFELVPPERMAGLRAPVPEDPDLLVWRGSGAEAVLATKLLPQGDQIALEGRLYDVAGSEMLLGKRYGGETDLARHIAHKLADEVTVRFTGQRGTALSRMAFVSRRGQGKELYIMDYDGHRLRRITTTEAINLSPAWSPDGNRLAFLSFREKFPAIFILGEDGRVTRLATGGGDLNSAPDWSPDGRSIVYSSTRDGNCEIYRIEPATGRERRLTHHAGIDSSPSWSPTGREIAFTSDRSGPPQVYVMDSDGAGVRRITYEGTRNDSPAWSPRGDRIAYVSRIEGRFALMVLDLATQKSTPIFSGPFNCEDPRWSADGRHLTFASDRSGGYQIYTIALDGGNLRQLTRGEPCYTPDWSR